MFEQELRLDIHIIKFQDYIRRKPNRPFGYYGLGVQYMLSGKPIMADRMFMHALKLNPDYVPARLGKLDFLLFEKKFVAAARYYNKYKDLFCRKKINRNRINRMTSRLYSSKSLSKRSKSLYSQLVLRQNFLVLNRMHSKNSDNPVSGILLSILQLKDGRGDEKAVTLYRYCVELPEISDKLRWDLLKVLSKKTPEILFDEKIACLFSDIPENAYGTDYANFLLKNFIYSHDEKKVIKAFSSFQKKLVVPSKESLWHYLSFCNERNIWHPSLSYCCQKLISVGWVDRLVVSTIKELNRRGLWENSHDMDKFLSLFEYA